MSMRKKYRTAVKEQFPEEIRITIGGQERLYMKAMSLRYGENPHQPAAFYRPAEGPVTVGGLRLLKSGKSGLSMTNVQDVDNAMRIVGFFGEPACAVMKHVNPSGAAVRNKPSESLREVYRKARDCDALAAYGSVVGFNAPVDEATAEEIMSSYVEAVVAPGYDPGCMAHFEEKKDIRIMEVKGLDRISRWAGDPMEPLDTAVMMDGSLVLQAPMLTKVRSPTDLRWVTKRQGTAQEVRDLLFSWYVCMNVRSNGVVLSRGGATIGVGT